MRNLPLYLHRFLAYIQNAKKLKNILKTDLENAAFYSQIQKIKTNK